MGNSQTCVKKSIEAHREIHESLAPLGFVLHQQTLWAFRVSWPRSDIGLSISVPLESNEYAHKYGWQYETTLWHFSYNSVVYSHKLKYDDNRKFASVQDVIKELHRVRSLTEGLDPFFSISIMEDEKDEEKDD